MKISVNYKRAYGKQLHVSTIYNTQVSAWNSYFGINEWRPLFECEQGRNGSYYVKEDYIDIFA